MCLWKRWWWWSSAGCVLLSRSIHAAPTLTARTLLPSACPSEHARRAQCVTSGYTRSAVPSACILWRGGGALVQAVRCYHGPQHSACWACEGTVLPSAVRAAELCHSALGSRYIPNHRCACTFGRDGGAGCVVRCYHGPQSSACRDAHPADLAWRQRRQRRQRRRLPASCSSRCCCNLWPHGSVGRRSVGHNLVGHVGHHALRN